MEKRATFHFEAGTQNGNGSFDFFFSPVDFSGNFPFEPPFDFSFNFPFESSPIDVFFSGPFEPPFDVFFSVPFEPSPFEPPFDVFFSVPFEPSGFDDFSLSDCFNFCSTSFNFFLNISVSDISFLGRFSLVVVADDPGFKNGEPSGETTTPFFADFALPDCSLVSFLFLVLSLPCDLSVP
jgi:hypothetical protein